MGALETTRVHLPRVTMHLMLRMETLCKTGRKPYTLGRVMHWHATLEQVPVLPTAAEA